MPLSFAEGADIPVSVYKDFFSLAMALAIDPVALVVDAVEVRQPSDTLKLIVAEISNIERVVHEE